MSKSPTLARRQAVSKALRTLALHVHHTGTLTRLAGKIQAHPVTLSVWTKNGYVPYPQVVTMRAVLGSDVVTDEMVDTLCPANKRRGA